MAEPALYRKVDGALRFVAFDVQDGAVLERRGTVGEVGALQRHAVAAGEDADATLGDLLAAAETEGYAPIDLDAQATLLIEYDTQDDDADPVDRHALQAHLDDLLHSTGLGECDSSTSGGGTLELCCFVVDFALARKVIDKALRGGPFGGYRRIARED